LRMLFTFSPAFLQKARVQTPVLPLNSGLLYEYLTLILVIF